EEQNRPGERPLTTSGHGRGAVSRQETTPRSRGLVAPAGAAATATATATGAATTAGAAGLTGRDADAGARRDDEAHPAALRHLGPLVRLGADDGALPDVLRRLVHDVRLQPRVLDTRPRAALVAAHATARNLRRP